MSRLEEELMGQAEALERFIMVNDEVSQSQTVPRVEFGTSNASFTVLGNTFFQCPLEAGWVTRGFRCENNIFYRSAVSLAAGTIACNDSWPDSLVDEGGNDAFEGNLCADPLFCDEETADLRLAIQSPCAPDNSPEGCGLIGALPAECDIVPVEETSWGAIKARFK